MYSVVIIAEDFLTRKNLIQNMPWSEYDCKVVGEASDPSAAMPLILQTKPHILIVDTHFPDGDGLSLWESVQDKFPCQCIFISDHAQFELAQKALNLGARGYLLKPVQAHEFVNVLSGAVQTVHQKQCYDKMKEQLGSTTSPIPAFVERYLEKDSTSFSKRYWENAVRYIGEHYKEDLTGKTVAANLGISESYLGKLFRQYMGYSFLEYLTMHRVYVALDLLSQTDLKTYQIAEMVGYRDARHFSDVFKKLVGVTPTQYRNR